MKIHHLSVAEALASLHSGPGGLTLIEARRRLEEFGLNQVERPRRVPLLTRFVKGFTHFFALILWVAAALAFMAEFSDPGQGMAVLGGAILGVIGINGLFSFVQEYRAERAISALEKFLPQRVKLMREQKIVEISAQNLVPGDVILLEEGDHIPADCRLIEAFGVRVNNATVTGEALPQGRDIHSSDEEDMMHSKNILLAGTAMVSGQAKALVFATGMHTEFGKIAHLTQSPEQIQMSSPLQREIQRLSRLIALLSSTLGVVFFFIGQISGLSFWENFIFAIGILVANVPEGLLPTVTLALALGSQRMAKRNALIRHLPAVETLGSATVICTDKTGTLTQNRMAVKKLFLADRCYNVLPEFEYGPLADTCEYFFATALLCHNLKETEKAGDRSWLGDPMEAALMDMAKKVFPRGVGEVTRIDEIPFDTGRKRMSILYRTPRGHVLYTKGALEALLPLCGKIHRNGTIEALTEELQAQLLQAQNTMAQTGLRVLAFAYRSVDEKYDRDTLEHELILTGLAGLEDPPRPEVPDAIRRCKEAGIKVIMITGDHPHTAVAIAREIGLVQSTGPIIITGEQLRRLSNTQLQLALDSPEILFTRMTADQKMRIVSALQRKKEIVAVTGDGVNDAPALKKADIGIAMGMSGTDVAREAADMVLLDDNFASIVAAVEEGRAVFDNIQKFLTYILTSNIPEIVPYLVFVLFKIPLPLTIVQILAVDLGTDMLPALGLGVERPEPGVMQRPPRPRHKRLLSGPLLLRAYLFLGVIEAIAAVAAFFYVLKAGGWQYGQMLSHDDPLYLQATTACLSAIIVMQVINVFLCRNHRGSVFHYGWLSNKLILWGIFVEILLIVWIDYSPMGNEIFGTAPISIEVWLFIIPFALGMLILEELRKWLVRVALR